MNTSIPCRLLVALLFMVASQQLSAQNCTVNAGIDGAICPGDAFVLKGKTNGNTVLQAGVPGVWSQIGGPAVTLATPVISTNNDGSRNVNVSVSGYSASNIYTFRFSSQCTDGSLIYQDVEYSTKLANIANAGANLLVCPGTSTQLSANALTAGESGVWSVVGNTNGVVINSPTSPNSTLAIPSAQSGVTTLRWTLTNTNGCVSMNDITVSNGGGVTPVTSGSDQVLNSCYDLTTFTQLDGSFAGDNTRGQQGTWELISGPGSVVFDNSHVNNTWVRGLVEGTYILRWNVSGPCVTGSPTMKITVPAPTKGVTLSANNTQTFCDLRTTAILSGPVAGNTGESVAWQRIAGTGVIANSTSPTTSVSGLTAGSTSVFRYTVTSTTGCASSGNYTITYVTAPTISLTPPTTSPITLNCGDNTTSIPFTYSGGDQTQWLLVSAPSAASIINVAGTGYNNVSGNSLFLSGLNKIGTYIIRLKRTTNNGAGGCADAFVDVAILVSQLPTPSNAGTKQFLACNVTQTDLAGNDATNGSGLWSIVSQPSGSPAVTIDSMAKSTTHISNLVNGAYTFRWIITGNDGCNNEQSDVTVIVASTTPTQANAGSNLSVCNATPIKLNANTPILNETGTWTASPSVAFSDIHDPHAVITGLAASAVYYLTWTITNSCGSTSHTVQYTSTATAGPQKAVAAADVTACITGTTINLTGNTPLSGETGTWTQVGTTPAAVSFAPTTPADGKTLVSGLSAAGTYQFQWSIEKNSPGCVASEAIVTVTKSAGTTVATANPATATLCGNNTSLTGNAPAATETGTWTQVEGPGGAVITSPNAQNTTVTGLISGRYTFRWTIANGACASTFADAKINVSIPPTAATISGVVSATAAICNADNTSTYTLTGNDVASGLWTIQSGPNNPTFSSYTAYNAQLSNLVAGTYQLKWTSRSGFVCPASEATLTLSVQQKAAVVNSVVSSCAAELVELRGSEGSTGVWTQQAGDVTTSTITAIAGSTNAALATTANPGTYHFIYSVTGTGTCAGTTTATKTITISGTPSSAVITKANSVALVNSQVTYCMGNNATYSVPLEVAAITTGTGSWTILSKPSGYSSAITSQTATTFTLPNAIPGSYLLAWNVTNGACGTNQDIVRVILEHNPTTSIAGSNQSNVCNSNIVLNGNTPVYGVGVWSKISGDASAVIDQPNNPATKITNAAVGTYVFRWTITTGCTTSFSDVTVQVSSTPPNTANAGVAQELCNVTTVNLSGNAISGSETGLWTRTSGPNIPNITTPSNNSTSVTGMIAGTYVFQWALTNGACVSNSTVQVKINGAPSTANAGTNQDVCLYTPLSLGATAPGTGIGTWTVISKPGTQEPVFGDIHANNSVVNGLEVGVYVFRWTVANGNCAPANNYSDVTITVKPPVTPAFTGIQQVVCVGSIITLSANTPTVGTAMWTVSPSGPVIASATLSNTTVSGLNTKGTYLFTWTISGSCGVSASTTQVIVQDAPGNNSFIAASDICYNTSTILTGTDPTGGDGTNYTYKWQQSANNITYSDLASGNVKTYTTGNLTSGTWFRRLVTSGVCGVTATSAPLFVNVYSDVTGNTVTYSGTTAFCTSGDPGNIVGNTVLNGGGGGPYTYKWQRSTDGSVFSDIVPAATTADYDPVAETAGGSILNVYYRRLAYSAASCVSIGNVIQVTVLPTITNTIVNTTLDYCSPVAAATYTLNSTAVSGGNGSYTYNWQISTDGGGSWVDASGTRNGQTYTLEALTNGSASVLTYMFRRQVFSGACTSNSTATTVNVYPAIGNNTIIAPASPVCSGVTIGAFNETTPTGGGQGAYTYTWQRATNSGFTTGLTTVASTQAYSAASMAPASITTYYFRRMVTTAGTGCTNTSPAVTVTVQPALNNVIGGTQTICNNTTPAILTNTTNTGGDGSYTYIWRENINGAGYTDAPGTNNAATYTPATLTTGASNSTYQYIRVMSSGACAAVSSTAVSITVKPYATLSNVTNSSGEVVVPAVTYGQNVVITPAAASVTSPVFKFYADAAKTMLVATGGNITVTTSTLTESKLAAGTYSGSGTFPVRYYITVSGSNYCDNLTPVPTNITVNKAVLTVTADAKTKIYGAVNPALTATITGYQYSETFATAGVTGTAPTISTTATDNSPVSPPTYPITLAGGAYTAANYTFSYVNNALTVTPRVITVTANSYTKTYGNAQTFATDGSAVTVTSGTVLPDNTITAATVTSAGAPATATVAGSPYTTVVTAGTVIIRNSNLDDVTSNYTINRANGTLTISKVALTYKAISDTKTYGSVYTFATDGTAVTLQSGTLVSGQVLTAATVTSSGAAANAAVAGSPYNTIITNGSVVIKDANGAGSDVSANYDITLLTGTLTLNTKAITITANNDSKTYGDVKTFATNGTAVAVTAGGPLLSGESITAATVTSVTGAPASATVAGSTYPIAITGGTVQIFNGATNVTSNYAITLANGALTVNPRAITVTPKLVQKQYGSTYAYPVTATGLTITGSGVASGQTVTGVTITSPGTINTAPVILSPFYTSTITNASLVIKDGSNNDVTTNYTITLQTGQLEVTKAPLIITAANKTKVYDGAVFGGTYTIQSYSSFVNGEDPSVLTGSIAYGGTSQTAVNVGAAYTIIPSGVSSGNYNISFVNGTLSITARAVTINSSAMTKVYGSTRAYTLSDASVDASTPLASGDALFSIVQSSVAGDPAKANVTSIGSPYTVAIGTAVIRKGGTDVSSNYTITYNTGTLAVTPLAINVKANPVTKVYGDVYTIPTDGSNVATNGVALLSGQSFTQSTVTVANSGDLAPAPVVPTPGPYTLTPTAVTIMEGVTNVTSNYNITYQTDVLTVTKRQLTVTAKDVTKTYGTLHTFANTASEVNVTGVSTPVFAPNNAISGLALTSNGTPANAAVSATPYPIVVTNGSVVIKDANGTGADVTANYDITLVNGGLTINKATLTFKAKDATKVYGDVYTFATDGTASTMTGSLVNGNTISVNPVVTATNSGATAPAAVSGTYATQITSNSVTIIDPLNANANVTSNYDITLQTGTFTITKRQITVTAKNVTKTYGTLHTFANTASEVNVTGVSTPVFAPNNAISGLALTSNGTPANAAASATPYPIVVTNGSVVIKDANGTGADVTANYDITLVNGGLTINKATLTFTAKDVVKTYGDAYTFPTDGTASIMTGSLVNGNIIGTNPVVTSAGALAAATAAGSYQTVITPNSAVITDPLNANADVTSNYTITIVPGTLTINKRAVTFKANDLSKPYGTVATFATDGSAVTVTGGSIAAANQLRAASVTSATGSPATAAVAGNTYSINITNGTIRIEDGLGTDVTTSYDITLQNGALTVTKVPLVITAANQSKVYDGLVYTGGYSVLTYTGFVNGENESAPGVLGGAASYGGASQMAVNAGSYPITISGITAANYTITFHDGTLTIGKRPVSITAYSTSKKFNETLTLANNNVSVTTGSLVPGDVLSGTVLTSTGVPVSAPIGSYPIVITPATAVIKSGTATDVSANYNITYVDGLLTVVANIAPVANNDNASTNPNTPVVINVTANDTDADGTIDVTTVTIITPPQHGTVTVNTVTGQVTYTPDTDFYGTDVFTYTVKDNSGSVSNVATVNITVGQPPVATNDSAKTNPSTPVTIDIVANDVRGAAAIDPATVVIVAPPAHGTFTKDPVTGKVVYTPNAGYYGTDVFTYTVKDINAAVSNIATVTITVNKPPVANNNTAVTNPNAPVTIDILANDVVGDAALDPSTVTIVTPPAHGTFTKDPATGKVTYTPAPGYYGTDVFTYTVKDANGAISNIATVTITVNKSPVANNNEAITNPDTPVTIDVLGNDVPGDAALVPSTLTIVKQPSHGRVTKDPVTGKVVYTPAPGYFGTDDFTYTVKDANGAISNVATVNIIVNKPPVAVNDSAFTITGKPVTVPLLDNDKKGDTVLVTSTVTIVLQPKHGTLQQDSLTGNILYTPDPGYYGKDTLTYTVTDKNGIVSNIATAVITVYKPPVANDDRAVTNPATPVEIDLLSNDAKGDGALVPSTVTIATPPAHGKVTVDPATGKVVYTPDPGYYGTDTFTYTVTDANGAVSNIATASVTINKPPVAVNDAAKTKTGVPVTIDVLLNDLKGDSDLDPASIVVVSQPLHGTLTIDPVTGKIVYTPAAGYFGNDQFTYTVKGKDGSISNVATVSLVVEKPPVAADDTANTDVATPVTIRLADNDAAFGNSLDPASITILAKPAHGTVVANSDGTVVYTPDNGYEGVDTFTYTIRDKNGNTSNVATATVTIISKKPDLYVTKKLITTPTRARVGSMIEYEIEVGNLSTAAAHNVIVSDPLPANLGGTAIDPGPQGTYNAATRTVTWKIATLNGGDKMVFRLKVQVISGGGIMNIASVASDEADANMANNRGASEVREEDIAGGVSADPPEDIFIPNVITPNGDGKNDKFNILGLSRYANTKLMIYNRWGNMVYQSSNYNNDWEGKGLNEGTYYYVLMVNKPSGPKSYEGWVQLIRK